MIQKLDISFTGPQKALFGFCLQGFPQTGPPQGVDCLIQVDQDYHRRNNALSFR